MFLDFAKAFDNVPHNKILLKLYVRRVNRKIDFAKAYLDNRVQYAEVHNKSSDTLPATSRVPQGLILGPILFLICINDIVNLLGFQVTIKLFVDACVLCTPVKLD